METIVIDWTSREQEKEWEAKRERAREKGPITFDCRHALISPKGVICRLEHFTRLDPPLGLGAILRGRSVSICHTCHDFEES